MIKLVQALMCLNVGLQRESFLAERRLCGVNVPWTFRGGGQSGQSNCASQAHFLTRSRH